MKKPQPLPHPPAKSRGVKHAPVYGPPSSSMKAQSPPTHVDPDPFRPVTGTITISDRK
jgi:hypothetical protein